MAKRKIQRRLVRTQENQVTHVIEQTVLDAPQLAYERTVAAIDRVACELPPSDTKGLYLLAFTCRAYLTGLEQAEQPELYTPEPLATLEREWVSLLPSQRVKFAELLRARLAKMVPNMYAA